MTARYGSILNSIKVWPGAAAAVVGAWPGELQQRCLQAAPRDSSEPDAGASPAAALSTGCAPRALCIGVGGGALPLFLSHHFPGLLVDAVRTLNPKPFV